MQRTRTSITLRAAALPLALVLGVVGCANGNNAGTTDTDPTAEALSGTLNASGATFPQAFYEEAIAAYNEGQPGVTINYAGGGSGKGRTDLQNKLVDFAGSDGLIKAEDKPKYPGTVLYFPTVAGPITVSYNLPGINNLKLTPDVIAKVFQREIKTWNDAAIKADNPDAALPATPITVAHRSDGSGTTEQFTKYLGAAATNAWKLGSGSTVSWPADTQGGQGNTGVAGIVKQTAGAVGYVDLSDAKATGLQIALVRNKAGKFVAPTPAGVSAALAGVTVNEDLTYNPLDAAGDDAYPIAAPTWILAYAEQSDAGRAELLKAFLEFVVTDGQDLAGGLNYARLPDELAAKSKAQIDRITVVAGS
ncbi:MAG: phosphate ABC transporter substrate-binding protein PstS [Actinomycetota bacterium]